MRKREKRVYAEAEGGSCKKRACFTPVWPEFGQSWGGSKGAARGIPKPRKTLADNERKKGCRYPRDLLYITASYIYILQDICTQSHIIYEPMLWVLNNERSSV